MEYRCVHCGSGIKTLFVQYSPGNIRLMKCDNCKEVADGYIECEIMILVIDLILHKQKAYRHFLYNMLNPEIVNLEGILWKSSFVFLLLDACRSLALYGSEEDCGFSISSLSSDWAYGELLMNVFLGNIVFFCVLLLAIRMPLKSLTEVIRYKDLLLAVIVSSYFKIFLIAMMVWEFPSSVIFIIDGFILSSNAVAMKVVTQSTMTRCIGVCFSAHAAKFLASRVLEVLYRHP